MIQENTTEVFIKYRTPTIYLHLTKYTETITQLCTIMDGILNCLQAYDSNFDPCRCFPKNIFR